MPMMISTQPAVCRLNTEVLVVTANARIAPTATSASPTPVFMVVLSLSGRRRSSGRGCWREGVGVAGLEQAALQMPERPGQEAGDVHLRDAEPVADRRLGQVAVRSEEHTSELQSPVHL